MNAKALLYSFSLKPNIAPPDFSATKRSFSADDPRPQTPFWFRVRIRNREQYCCFFRVSGSKGKNRMSGKVFADVKSEAHDISEPVDKFDKGLNDVVLVKQDLEVESTTEITGGIWADTIGGKQVLAFGVIWWSITTILTHVATKIGLPFLLVVHAFLGIGEGVAMPTMNNILSKWILVAERSRSLALVYSGMYLGSVTGLAFSPYLIHQFGWPSVFYSRIFSSGSQPSPSGLSSFSFGSSSFSSGFSSKMAATVLFDPYVIWTLFTSLLGFLALSVLRRRNFGHAKNNAQMPTVIRRSFRIKASAALTRIFTGLGTRGLLRRQS
ncbi:hypothetical protein TB1_000896 [Malus domestica]